VTQGVGSVPVLVGPGTEPCPPYGDSGWFYRLLADGVLFADSGLGQATMNEDPFSAPEWWLSTDAQGNRRSEVGPLQFAEAVLNLTELGYEADCSTFSTVHAKSRASLEVASDLKDLAGPLPLGVNCRLDGYKFLDFDGDCLWEEGDEPALENWEIRLSDGRVTHTNADGYYAFEDLPSGTYTVREDCPGDWAQTAPGLTGFDTCGDFVHTAEISPDSREVHLPDFGNGQPALSLTCTSPSDVFVGDDIEYEISVTNVGNVDLRDVEVAASLIGLSETLDLAPGESQTFTGKYSTRNHIRPCGGGFSLYLPLVVRGPDSPLVGYEPDLDTKTNAVTASGRYALATVEAFDDCVTRLHELQVRKDIQTSLKRQYQCAISKEVDDPGPLVLFPNDSAQLVYTVTAGLGDPPFVDRDWIVEGTITIDNPAPITAELESVTDMVSPNIVATVNCPSLSVRAGDSLTCSYGPVQLPDGSDRKNAAAATLKNNNGLTADFCATAGVDFSQARVEEIDEEGAVYDKFPDVPERRLGSWRYDQLTRPFTDTWTITATGAKCDLIEINNTAKMVLSDTGTVCTDTVVLPVLEVCTVTVGYEDLPMAATNDWDYNDLVINIKPELDLSPERDLLAATFAIRQAITMTAYTHAFHLQPYKDAFTCAGTYTKTVKTGVQTDVETGPYNPGDSYLIIPDTGHPPDLVELVIDFEVPAVGACRWKWDSAGLLDQPHGQGLFFDPWLKVVPYWCKDEDCKYQIHATKPEGVCDCRILTVPADWTWPMGDGCPIWCVYEGVDPPPPESSSGPTFELLWWKSGTNCLADEDCCEKCEQCDCNP